jgi:stearoyl-CoA desaturase (delta-9 desaturase)
MWMIPTAHWAGLFSIILALQFLFDGLSLWWAVVWIAGHVFGSIAVSVGLHRYFTHGAFKTNKFWHNVMAFYSTLTVQGSALGWEAAHTTHHEHADTPGDPHFTGWSYLWKKQYNDVPMSSWRVRNTLRSKDKVLIFNHRYAVFVILAWVLILLGVGYATGNDILPLVFGYLAPLGTTHSIGALHQVLSHKGGKGPKDMPQMDLFLPAAGEWNHKHHHENPRDPKLGTKWWHFDYGYWFIQLIRTDR